ncbi:MAG: inhibitor of cysteine peptidase [Pirellulaceae bacterium]|jgi:inhibitor of cysteine peptidase
MKIASNRTSRRRPRRLQLEDLESRELLASIADDGLFWPGTSPATYAVRNDAVGEELDLSYYHRDYVSEEQDWNEVVAVTITSQPNNGTVAIADDGVTLLITGNSQTSGHDSFTYTYESKYGADTTATAYLNFVDPVTAVDDWERVDTSADLTIVDNDQAFGSYAGVTISAVGTTSAGGTVAVSADGLSVNYVAATGYVGLDTFTYTAVDEFGASDTATVTVDVNSSSDPDYFASQQEFESFIRDGLLRTHSGRFGQVAPSYDWQYFARGGVTDANIVFAVSDGLNVAPLANEASGTNVQVQGVDEGDLIKTDGSFLYQLSNRTEDSEQLHELVVMDVRNANYPSVARRLSFDGPLIEQYLIDDRLTVIWTAQEQDDAQWFWGYNPNITPGSTMVSIFDVSDPTALQMIEETKLDGSHFQSRAVDGTVYVVTSANLQPYIELEKTCLDAESSQGCFYETATEFVDRMDSQISELAMPSFTATDDDGATRTGTLVDYSAIRISDAESNWNLTNVVSFDVDGSIIGPEASSAYVTTGQTEIYVSTSAIYLAERTNSLIDDGIWSQETEIRKLEFELYGHGVTQTAEGSIPGWLDNSFSMDEHNGFLRITAMSNWQSGADLYVMEHSGTALEIVGQINDMAPGEQIYATRFVGDRGYVVTFRTVDPLFVIDLSDPTNPVVKGQLKVPGFSNYLQPIGEDHLIGIGRNADETSGLYEELQISLFNVSDPNNPTLVDRYSFEGGRDLWTPVAPSARAMGDHHAVTYLPQHHMLALPIYSQSRWFGWTDVTLEDGSEIQNGIRMFDIDLENGITEAGNIDFDDRAQRSVRVGDYLYGISSSTVKIVELGNPQQVEYELYVGLGATDDLVATREQGPVTIDVLQNDNLGTTIAQLSLSTPPDVGSATISDDGQSIVYNPPDDFFGRVTMQYDVAGEAAGRTSASVELVYKWDWHNGSDDTDINEDGSTSANDALVLFNLLNDKIIGDVEDLERQTLVRSPIGKHRPDANNDGRLNVTDALKVVNKINLLAAQKLAASISATATGSSTTGSSTTGPLANRLINLSNEAQGELLTEQAELEHQLPIADPRSVDKAIDEMSLEISFGEKGSGPFVSIESYFHSYFAGC